MEVWRSVVRDRLLYHRTVPVPVALPLIDLRVHHWPTLASGRVCE